MKEMIISQWRRWATVLLGVSLFASPWVFGISGAGASSMNSWIVGTCLVLVTWRVPIVSGAVAAGLSGVALGVWLLASPFALGYFGSTAAWGAWITGALTVALSATPQAIFDLAAWTYGWRLRRGLHNISPQQIARYEEPEETVSPEALCRWIVERSYRIQRTMREHPPQMEAEMCVWGYRSCVNDMITLARMIDKERPEAGPMRRLRLRASRNMAARSLSRARQALPADALRPTHA